MDATETIRLSRVRADGALIEFEERPETNYRAYHFTPEGGTRTRYSSVTTLIGKFTPKESLLNWYERMGAAGAVRLERAGLLAGVEPMDAVEEVRKREAGAAGHSGRAKLRGKEIHAILERYARDGDVPNPVEYPVEWRGYIRALALWLAEAELQPTAVERLVAHAGMRYAGRYDLRGYLAGIDSIIDLKTRERPGVYWDDLLQVSGYDLADRDCGAPPATARVVVSIGPEGTYVAEAAPDSLLDVWRAGLGYLDVATPIRSAWESSQRAKRKAAA